MDSYSYPDRHVWHVLHVEGSYCAEDVQRHVGDLGSMLVAVSLRQTRCHHVGITNGLHLDNVNTFIKKQPLQCVIQVPSMSACLWHVLSEKQTT